MQDNVLMRRTYFATAVAVLWLVSSAAQAKPHDESRLVRALLTNQVEIVKAIVRARPAILRQKIRTLDGVQLATPVSVLTVSSSPYVPTDAFVAAISASQTSRADFLEALVAACNAFGPKLRAGSALKVDPNGVEDRQLGKIRYIVGHDQGVLLASEPQRKERYVPLLCAVASFGWARVTSFLCDTDSSIVRIRDALGNSAMHYASTAAVVKALIAHGLSATDRNKHGDTALFVVRGNSRETERYKALLNGGCRFDDVNALGFTALMQAVVYRKPEAVKALLESGADWTTTSSVTGQNALDVLWTNLTDLQRTVDSIGVSKARTLMATRDLAGLSPAEVWVTEYVSKSSSRRPTSPTWEMPFMLTWDTLQDALVLLSKFRIPLHPPHSSLNFVNVLQEAGLNKQALDLRRNGIQ